MFYGKLTRTTIPKILSVSVLTTKEHPYKVKKKKNRQGSFFIIYEKVDFGVFRRTFCDLYCSYLIPEVMVKFTRKTRGHHVRLIEICTHLNTCVSGDNCQAEALESSGLLISFDIWRDPIFLNLICFSSILTGTQT